MDTKYVNHSKEIKYTLNEYRKIKMVQQLDDMKLIITNNHTRKEIGDTLINFKACEWAHCMTSK